MRPFIILICTLFVYRAAAQQSASVPIPVSAIRYFDSIGAHCHFYEAPKNTVEDEDLPYLPYRSEYKRLTVRNTTIEQECFLRFYLYNDTDSAKDFYFVPGFYLSQINMFETKAGSNNTLRELPTDTLSDKLFRGTRLLSVAPGDTMVYFTRFNFVRSNTNIFRPSIVEKDFFGAWVMMRKNIFGPISTFTYIATGIMLLMIFYSIALYIQNKSNEFLFYAAYASCITVMIFLKYFLGIKESAFNIFFEEYLDFMILCGSVYFYLGFIRKFLNTGKREPILEKMLQYCAGILSILLIVFSYIYFYTDKYIILNILENYIIKILIFILSIIVIIYSFRKKDPLLRYIAAGNIALVFFSMISLAMIIYKWKPFAGLTASLLNNAMFYYELGLIFELLFFSFGLAYKNKIDIITQVREREQLKLENERKEFENQMAVMAARQDERDRISADMHDDLGAGVTAIRLMSEIVKSKIENEKLPEIDKISNSANELLGKMNAIIWTMKSSNDSVESLIAYLRAYATEYFDNTAVECNIQVQQLAEHELSGEKRRNIFLSFKETLNNILKHAKASKVNIGIYVDQQLLKITIHDNGVGIDTKNLRRFGNGLNNIKKRIQSISGDFTLTNDNGTCIGFEIQL